MSKTPHERIQDDLRAALKAGRKAEVSTLRLLLAELEKERIEKRGELDEAAFWAVVKRGIKQRRESAEQYRAGDREEAAEREEAEAEILEGYLPRQADEAEIEAAIAELLSEQGLSGPAAIGPVMQAMMDRFAGRADGAVVHRIARRLLQ